MVSPSDIAFQEHLIFLVLGFGLLLALTFMVTKVGKLDFRNASTALVSMFGLLMLIETGLWVSGITVTHNEKKSGRYWSERSVEVSGWHKVYEPSSVTQIDRLPEFVHYVRSNSLGLADSSCIGSVRDSLRIVVLGDSFTEGVGAMGLAYSWPKVFESSVADRCGVSTCFLNAGIAGSDPVFGLKLLTDRLPVTDFNWVLLCINESDIRDIAVKGGFERFRSDGTVAYRPSPFAEQVYARSFVSRLFFKGLLGYDSTFTDEDDHLRAAGTINHVLDNLMLIGMAHGFSVALVILPTQAELNAPNPYLQQIGRHASKRGMLSLSLTEAILTEMGQQGISADDIYWPLDAHFNRAGYSMVGELIAEEFCNHLAIGHE